MTGVFDADAARAALRSVTGGPTTPAHGHRRVPVEFTEASAEPASAVERAVAFASYPVDPAARLLRLLLLRVAPDETLLVADAHGLVPDLPSLDRLLTACAHRYTVGPVPGEDAALRGFFDGGTAVVPAAPVPDTCVPEAWADRPGPPRPGARPGARLPFTLAALAGPGAGSGPADRVATVRAALVALLARDTGLPAVSLLVAPPPYTAPGTDVMPVIDVADDPAFDVLRRRVARRTAEAAAGPAAPDGERPPPAVRFAARPTRPGTFAFGPCLGTPVELPPETVAYDLALTVTTDTTTADAVWEYATDRCLPASVRRLARRLDHLAAAALEHPGARLSELPTLPSDERALVVSAWNRTDRPFPRTRTTAELFAEQVRRAPDAVAVSDGADDLTYARLNARANRLAHRLLAHGAGPDIPVGVCLERSVDSIVALLGVLKAGAAYLPLDPAHPPRRLAYVLRDAGAPAVVTRRTLLAAFEDTGLPRLTLDGPDAAEARAPDTDPAPRGTAENLAYVIYTSGSTGEPKGVAVPHRALSRLVKGADYAHLGPEETHLHLSPLTFDASLLEVWGALLNGGTLVLPPDLPFPDLLRVALERHPITTALLISPQLHVAARAFPEVLGRLRQLLVGGDVFSRACADDLLPRLADTGTRLIHVYGPTECTLFATALRLTGTDTDRATVPIGRPIANTRAHVLDEELNPLPIGVPGELWLGGDGLARGYLGRPRLTAERFRPDPFGPPGGRLYGTGDLARWLPDGTLEFLGRRDDQIKIRGYRVEPGEVDAVLGDHPDITEAATVLRTDVPGGGALVTYLIGGRHTPDHVLREVLAARVPEYMLPAAFVRLESMPLTPNGKLDRRALPPPRFGEAAGEAGGPALTPLEQAVHDAFAAVLDAEHIGPDDDFYELGGNSLLLVTLFEELSRRLPDTRPTLVDLIENRTRAGLAAVLAARRGEQPVTSATEHATEQEAAT
ncbi:non-ribosomal peptide synthetase [Streptomyces sp. XM4011]|uniref:non-ribosomal peptide synthetase n=1 Tax=Streptomyces TaxID=1883 RepID=UPI001FFB5B19|nr:non-ribosomal peptide synthetase [Streptomyces sp. XM4011]MCK1813217.1 non-ribosomal peptide synthetase [Streptomyces sp. XM4011]